MKMRFDMSIYIYIYIEILINNLKIYGNLNFNYKI